MKENKIGGLKMITGKERREAGEERKRKLKAMPLEKRARKLGGEWVSQMIDYFGGKLIEEPRMICPNCLRRATSFGDRGWQCLWFDCSGFSGISKDVILPSPAELKEYWKRKKLEEKINMFLKSNS